MSGTRHTLDRGARRRRESASLAGVMRMEHWVNRAEFGGAEEAGVLRDQCRQFVAAYLLHIESEERDVLTQAESLLSDDEWACIAADLSLEQDPLVGLPRESAYENLIAAIDTLSPAALGLGAR